MKVLFFMAIWVVAAIFFIGLGLSVAGPSGAMAVFFVIVASTLKELV